MTDRSESAYAVERLIGDAIDGARLRYGKPGYRNATFVARGSVNR